MYLLLFWIGLLGFIAMTLMGFSHGQTGHHGHGHGHATGHHSHAQGHHADFKSWLVISPLDIFSLALGAGGVGLLLAGHGFEAVRPYLAIVGALVLNYLVIRPLMSFLLRFVTNPSEGLEGSVAKTADVVTAFDTQGRGLVRLSLDGQNVQLLAQLDPAELHRGVRVHQGDEVVVLAVDPTRNTCRVTRELTAE